MASLSEHTPLYVDCMALGEWLLKKFDQAPGVLGPSLCRCSLRLLQAVVLALKDRDRDTQIDLADEQLIRLRVLLRLAVDTGRLDHRQYGFALEKVDAIGLDHFIKRELKISGYLRYMDDFVLFGDREAALREAAERIGDWLAERRRLTLKDPDARPVSNRRPAVFLGFRLSRAGIGPGPKARARLRRRLHRITGGDGEHLARSLQAYRGMWRALGGQ